MSTGEEGQAEVQPGEQAQGAQPSLPLWAPDSSLPPSPAPAVPRVLGSEGGIRGISPPLEAPFRFRLHCPCECGAAQLPWDTRSCSPVPIPGAPLGQERGTC